MANDKIKYYNGDKLLSLKDANKLEPYIYMCVTNRSAGKTFYFTEKLLNNWVKTGRQFGYIVRYQSDLLSCGKMFMASIGWKYPQYEIETKVISNKYAELHLIDSNTEDELGIVGYGLAINTSSYLRRYSGSFAGVDWLLFDEFQEEFNRYCPDEVNKLLSLYQSVARGGGSQLRNEVKLIMLSNDITEFNPYYFRLNVLDFLKHDSKYVRGQGWVLERQIYESASEQIKEAGFLAAFGGRYVSYSAGDCSLISKADEFVSNENKSNYDYWCTLKINDNVYGLWWNCNTTSYFISKKYDEKFQRKYSLSAIDSTIDFPCVDMLLKILKNAYKDSNIRFETSQIAQEFTQKIFKF